MMHRVSLAPAGRVQNMDDKREQRLLRRLGLKMADPDDLAIQRVACGRGFTFRHPSTAVALDPTTRQRIAGLVIPPAWREVRIAAEPQAHLQAVGRDEAGRLQYLYHPAWEEVRAARKIERLRRLGLCLPSLRVAVASDLAGSVVHDDVRVARRTMLAAAATLVDRLGLRAGHEAYAGPESGRGAATLLKRHVAIDGDQIKLAFRGKGGRKIEASLIDARLACVLAQLKEVRGSRLFKERNGRRLRPITAEDLNQYLREVSGQDISAKDFRTFQASARAIELLCDYGPATSVQVRRKCLAAVARQIGGLLNNTATVARTSYIHPTVIDRFEEGRLDASLLRPKWRHGLDGAETALMRLLDDIERSSRKAERARRSGAPSQRDAPALRHRKGPNPDELRRLVG
jgi:DNA topoisomerase I